MKRRVYTISFIVLTAVIALAIYSLSVERSDMWNTQKILVIEGQTGKIREINDKKAIKQIVSIVLKREKPGLLEEIDQPYSYSLEFFTPDYAYGPLLCYKDLNICRFEKDTLGYYIDGGDDFFNLIEANMKE